MAGEGNDTTTQAAPQPAPQGPAPANPAASPVASDRAATASAFADAMRAKNTSAGDASKPTPPTTQTNTPPGNASNNPTPEDGEVDDDVYFDLSDLGYKDMESLQRDLESIPNLRRDIQRLQEFEKGPKFKSDRHRLLYDLAGQAEGMEFERARQILKIGSMDLNAVRDQDKRWEAFRLSPELKGLSRDEIRKLFDREESAYTYDKDDVSIDDNERSYRDIKAKQATAQAVEKLEKLRAELTTARTAERSPEELAREQQAYLQDLEAQLSGFKGIQHQLRAMGENGERLDGSINFDIDAEQQLPYVIEAIADPQGWWDRMLEDSGIIQGDKVDFAKFGELVTNIIYQQDIRNQCYQQGREDEKARMLAGSRNLSPLASGEARVEGNALTGNAAVAAAFAKASGFGK